MVLSVDDRQPNKDAVLMQRPGLVHSEAPVSEDQSVVTSSQLKS